MNGVVRLADAYYTNPRYQAPSHLIQSGSAGGVQLWIYTSGIGWGPSGPVDKSHPWGMWPPPDRRRPASRVTGTGITERQTDSGCRVNSLFARRTRRR